MSLPIVILPGYLAAAAEYEALQQDLQRAGYAAWIVPLQIRSWLPTLGGRPVSPILQSLAETIRQVQSLTGSEQVNLIGHSAGGWIARIYLGQVPYHGRVWSGKDQVATLVTLGTPHISQERWTLSNLNFVNQNYPGAYWPQIKYVCVAGKATEGKPLRWQDLRDGGFWSQWLAYSSYRLTVGSGTTWGDGITPVSAAHLEGAINLTVTETYHSPRGQRRWYGSPDVLSDWIPFLQ
jgi:pimeloyl-ACP methyl ester carboxylesterase